MPILESIIGAVAPTLIGGLFGKSEKKDSQEFNERQYQLNKADYYEYRADDRAYVRRRTQAQRQYDAKIYQRDLKQTQADKKNERVYVERNRAADQARLNQFADESVATRGIDLQKMRDQAIAAGFNPLSVMGMAGMYSTEKNQALAGREGIGGAYSSAVPGGSGPSAGGYSTVGSGNGYARQYEPALASGGFISEAITRGLDTVFNSPLGMDMQGIGAEQIKAQAAQNTLAKALDKQNYRQAFGYDLTQVTPYRPAYTVTGPALKGGAQPVPDTSTQFVGENKPPSDPLYFMGEELKGTSQTSIAEAWESQYGEIAGEVAGLGSLAWDLGKKAWDSVPSYPETNKGKPGFRTRQAKPVPPQANKTLPWRTRSGITTTRPASGGRYR